MLMTMPVLAPMKKGRKRETNFHIALHLFSQQKRTDVSEKKTLEPNLMIQFGRYHKLMMQMKSLFSARPSGPSPFPTQPQSRRP